MRLSGTYDLRSETMNFIGELLTDASLADMTSGFKSLLARVAQPFFKRPGGGSRIPIRIAGPRGKPELTSRPAQELIALAIDSTPFAKLAWAKMSIRIARPASRSLALAGAGAIDSSPNSLAGFTAVRADLLAPFHGGNGNVHVDPIV